MESENGRDQAGKFAPGHPGYKKPGSTNKIAGEIKSKLADFLKERFEDLPGLFDKLKPGEKARLLSDLLQYVLPKTRELHIDDDTEGVGRAYTDLTMLSERTLKELLNGTTIIYSEGKKP